MQSCNQKRVEVTILISDKIDFKTRILIRDKEYFVMMKESIFQGNIRL